MSHISNIASEATFFMIACQNEHVDIVKLLISLAMF